VRLYVTTGTVPKRSLIRAGLALLAAFTALCTIFAAIVTAAQAWQEHAQARWPEVTARIDQCGLEQASTRRSQMYHIKCRLKYDVDAQQLRTNVFSSNVPSRAVWQYPPDQIAPLEQWLDEHPAGTPILVHYDPANHRKVVLVSTYLPPLGGPRTPSNLKLLAVCAALFLVLLTITRLTRPSLVGPPGSRRDVRAAL
jgi:hypothetical protein